MTQPGNPTSNPTNAYTVPSVSIATARTGASQPDDAWQVLHDFMAYCGVVEQPNIVRGLFS